MVKKLAVVGTAEYHGYLRVFDDIPIFTMVARSARVKYK